MAKPSVTRAPRRSSPSSSHRSGSAAQRRGTTPPSQQLRHTATLRRLKHDVRGELHSRLSRAQCALMTAILALEHNESVYGEISSSLRSHVYFPLRAVTEALDDRVHQ